LFGLFFGPEHGDDIFPRNVCWLSMRSPPMNRIGRNS
jgi:hypothetical protein